MTLSERLTVWSDAIEQTDSRIPGFAEDQMAIGLREAAQAIYEARELLDEMIEGRTMWNQGVSVPWVPRARAWLEKW